MKKIIINADDFGLYESCTCAIYEALNKQLINDISMVANGLAYERACQLIKSDDGFSGAVGIHFNLTEGRPLSKSITSNRKFVTDGLFSKESLINRAFGRPFTLRDKTDIYEELCAQTERIMKTCTISHADSHQHVHMSYYMLPIVIRVCKEYGIKAIRIKKNIQIKGVRLLSSKIYRAVLRANGFKVTDFLGNIKEYHYGQVDGVSELIIHPDYDVKGLLIDRETITYKSNGVIMSKGQAVCDVIRKHIDPESQSISYAQFLREYYDA